MSIRGSIGWGGSNWGIHGSISWGGCSWNICGSIIWCKRNRSLSSSCR
jgi:hypothetical protein